MIRGKIFRSLICALLGAVFFIAAAGKNTCVKAASLNLGSLNTEGLSGEQTGIAEDILGFADYEADYLAAYKDSAWKKNFTKAELRLMTAIIYAEANGMDFDAKVAVGNAVLNRMYDEDKYGYVSTIEEVIYDHKWGYQFSPVKDGSMARALKIYDSMDPDVYKSWQITAMNACKEAAKAALSGWKTIPDDYQYFNSHLEKQSVSCMENGWSFKPLSSSIYVNTVFGGEFWKSQPKRYPDGYYFMSTKIHLNVALGQQISFDVPYEKRKGSRSITLFYEISTCDLYIRSKFLDHSVPWKDILGLSIGVKWQTL